MDAFGVDAVLRRGHPQVIGLDVGAPGERQVVLLAVLQRDAFHADPLAVLKVNRLQIGEQSEMMIPPVGQRYGSSKSPIERGARAHLGSRLRGAILQEHEQSTRLVWPCRHTPNQHPASGCAIGYLLPLARPPLLPPAVDDAAAGHLQVLDLVEVEPLPALAGAPVARALRRNDVPGNLTKIQGENCTYILLLNKGSGWGLIKLRGLRAA